MWFHRCFVFFKMDWVIHLRKIPKNGHISSLGVTFSKAHHFGWYRWPGELKVGKTRHRLNRGTRRERALAVSRGGEHPFSMGMKGYPRIATPAPKKKPVIFSDYLPCLKLNSFHLKIGHPTTKFHLPTSHFRTVSFSEGFGIYKGRRHFLKKHWQGGPVRFPWFNQLDTITTGSALVNSLYFSSSTWCLRSG